MNFSRNQEAVNEILENMRWVAVEGGNIWKIEEIWENWPRYNGTTLYL